MRDLDPSPGFATIEEEYEARLRDAFVTHGADYIAIHSRRQRFQLESVAWAVAQGWLYHEAVELDDQSTEWRYRLTQEGRRHFGLTPSATHQQVRGES